MAAAPSSTPKRIVVESLTVDYLAGANRATRALDDVTVSVEQGRRVAIVGESGSGKSTLGLALLGLLPDNARLRSGTITDAGTNVSGGSAEELRSLRGRVVALVFQDAKTALDPLRTVGYQIAQPLLAHHLKGRAEATVRARDLLEACEIAQPDDVAKQYPHELSGGMRQRALIASALSADPSFLVADEPTSALDVTTQAAILDLLRGLSDTGATATILITHDLAVVASFADDVIVLYAGVVVEAGPREAVMGAPAHPYTAMLIASVPSLEGPRLRRMPSIPGSLPSLQSEIVGCRFEPRCPVGRGEARCRSDRPVPHVAVNGASVACHFPGRFTPEQAATEAVAMTRPVMVKPPSEPLPAAPLRSGLDQVGPIVVCRDVAKTFTRRSLASGTTTVRAVREIDLSIARGERLAMVGESGSGKTTLARILVGLEQPDRGDVVFGGKLITGGRRAASQRRHLVPSGAAQMVFQDPSDSLNPFHSLQEIISEPLTVSRGGRPSRFADRVGELLTAVGLDPHWAMRRPAQLSGGQRQRVAIARALASDPLLIVADEAVSSLDVSARGQILNLLSDLQRDHGFTCVHVSHDLSLVRHVCERVVVMYAGRIVEQGPVETLFASPRHPYTRALISAVPTLEGPKQAVARSADRLERQPAPFGCAYHRTCPWAQEICSREEPPPIEVAPDHFSACHFARELDDLGVAGPADTGLSAA
jgi:oligopeptide/dipeptide ABC transporter ATP-binding protein